MKLLIVLCSSRDVKPQTNISMANLVGYIIHKGDELELVKLDIYGGVAESLLPAARQRKLNFALEGDYTHIAMFDDDMVFPPITIHQLASHNKDFVFANVAQKAPNKISGVCLDLKTGKRINSAGKHGPEEVSYGTLACTLINLDAIRHTKAPHFEVLWEPKLNGGKGGYQGEDHYFFKKLSQNGIKFYCDHDLSHSVQHIGDFPYGFGQPCSLINKNVDLSNV